VADLADGETIEVQGSGSARYTLRNVGGVYSCSCPAWRNQSLGIERRTCKHLQALRGAQAELSRVGTAAGRGGASASASATGQASAAPSNTLSGSTHKASSAGPPLLLAHPWDNRQDLSGWWMSEKLDGVRAYWDGKTFLSRLGNEYMAPDWFVAGLPTTALDGELWGGRKRFQRTISVVRRQDRSDDWKEISFVVFDAPAMDAPFEERLEFCRTELLARRPPHAQHHAHERCRDLDHLRAELRRVEALGGEGLMMRRPGSRYEVGRSSSLLKVKSFFDAEARVVRHVPGAGRHKGRLGALEVELADGTRFSVGTGLSDQERRAPPPLGAVVTFRYQELSDAGVPRFPSFVGVRDDVQWPPDNALLPRANKVPGNKAPAKSASAKSAATNDASADKAASGKASTDEAPAPKRSFWTVLKDR
jgi:DNA ligase-1